MIDIQVEPTQYRVRFSRTPPPGQPPYDPWHFDENLEQVSAVLLEEGFGLPYRSTYKYKPPSGARYRAEGPFLYNTERRKQPNGIWTSNYPCRMATALVEKSATRPGATLHHAVEHYLSKTLIESVSFEYKRVE